MAISDGVHPLSQLAVTFGGFSPTAMDGVEATRKQIERIEEEQARKREQVKRNRELERARTSKPKECKDDYGNTWRYVVVDDSVARIIGVASKARTLTVPSTLDDVTVYSIAADALSDNDVVEEIRCPDSIEQIGSCAFRFCPNLKKVVLPACISEYRPSWFIECSALEEVRLPGHLEKLKLELFNNPTIKHLEIGDAVREIEPGMFRDSNLEEIEIDAKNPFLTTDGAGIYTHDKSVLLALAKRCERYEIAPECRMIARKAFDGHDELREVVMGEGLEIVGEFAFTHAGLCSFQAPSSLREVREKAFYYCRQLTSVELNEGLTAIGEAAFEESALASLHIPSTIEHIGNSITKSTFVIHSGPDCSITIDERSPHLFLDGEGGLYRREEDGIHLLQLIDREKKRYRVMEGTAVVDEYAFAFHTAIEHVVVPDGVTRIGASAFRYCIALATIELADSVREIGAEAFIDTELTSFRVPASLETLGKQALVTRSAHHGEEVPSLRAIEVAHGNERFYMECGMLIERHEEGDHVVLFSNSAEQVVFPDTVVSVEPYAFNNARGIRFLSLNKQLRTIGTSGLTTWCWIERIHVEVAEPVEGRTSFDFTFPNTPKSLHGISIGIGGASWVNVPGIMASFDICLINAHDYNAPRNSDNMPIYDQVRMVIDRLHDPFLLTDFNRSLYERLLNNHILEICVDVSRHDDRSVIDDLVELGYVNRENIEEVIQAVSRLQDAAMTGYLLELKRRRFGHALHDYDL